MCPRIMNDNETTKLGLMLLLENDSKIQFETKLIKESFEVQS